MSDTIMSEAMMSTSSMSSGKDTMCTGGNMNHDELDRILSKQDDIQPSSGFAASVMDAVRNEAAAPPPIPFPWKRALPVLLFAALALVAVLVAGVAAVLQAGRETVAPELASSFWSMLQAQTRGSVGNDVAWTIAALLVAFVSVKLSLHLASGRV